MGLKNKNRERRFKAKRVWFEKTNKKKYLWVNNIFPLALIISLIAFIYTKNKN